MKRKRGAATLPIAEARAANHVRYLGAACGNCGNLEKYVTNGHCVTCQRRATLKWAAANPEKQTALNEKHNAISRSKRTHFWPGTSNNPVEKYLRRKKSENRDPEKRKAEAKIKRKNTRENLLRHALLRLDRVKQNQPDGKSVKKYEIDLLMKGKDRCCTFCFEHENLTVDHILAIVRGGAFTRENLQWLCAHHNRQKFTKTNDEYIEWCEERGIDLPKIRQMKLGQAVLDDLF